MLEVENMSLPKGALGSHSDRMKPSSHAACSVSSTHRVSEINSKFALQFSLYLITVINSLQKSAVHNARPINRRERQTIYWIKFLRHVRAISLLNYIVALGWSSPCKRRIFPWLIYYDHKELNKDMASK